MIIQLFVWESMKDVSGVWDVTRRQMQLPQQKRQGRDPGLQWPTQTRHELFNFQGVRGALKEFYQLWGAVWTQELFIPDFIRWDSEKYALEKFTPISEKVFNAGPNESPLSARLLCP